jgi:hypothetical protein
VNGIVASFSGSARGILDVPAGENLPILDVADIGKFNNPQHLTSDNFFILDLMFAENLIEDYSDLAAADVPLSPATLASLGTVGNPIIRGKLSFRFSRQK